MHSVSALSAGTFGCGVTNEPCRASGDAALVALLSGEGAPVGVCLNGVEALLRDLDEREVGHDHAEEDEEEADWECRKAEEVSEG